MNQHSVTTLVTAAFGIAQMPAGIRGGTGRWLQPSWLRTVPGGAEGNGSANWHLRPSETCVHQGHRLVRIPLRPKAYQKRKPISAGAVMNYVRTSLRLRRIVARTAEGSGSIH